MLFMLNPRTFWNWGRISRGRTPEREADNAGGQHRKDGGEDKPASTEKPHRGKPRSRETGSQRPGFFSALKTNYSLYPESPKTQRNTPENSDLQHWKRLFYSLDAESPRRQPGRDAHRHIDTQTHIHTAGRREIGEIGENCRLF